MAKRKKKEHARDERTPNMSEPPAINVHVSGNTMDDVHRKMESLHGRSGRKGRRKSKRDSRRE